MDIRTLKIFMEVAEQSSFTRAAEHLGYSQPTVSFQIRQLEQELGVPLFDRIGHTVSLTDAGREALDYAQQICNLSREMTALTRGNTGITGTVRIGMADSLCSPLITREFGRLRQEYPGIRLQIYGAGTGELFRMLDHNEVDLICSMDSRVANMAYICASEEPVEAHFVASSRNPLAGLAQVEPQQLQDQPFLLTEKNMSYRRLMDERMAEFSLEIRPVLETPRADLICRLVEEDMGIAFLPDYVTEEAVAAGGLKRLKVPQVEVTIWKQLLYRRDKWLSPQMKAMLVHLAAIRLQ